jgi:hypothetical protein
MCRNLTLSDLIDLLEDYRAEYGDETPVQIQFQPSYPLKADIAGIACEHDIDMARMEDEEARMREYDTEIDTSEIEWPEPEPRVYILAAEGVGFDQNPYGDRFAWEVARR